MSHKQHISKHTKLHIKKMKQRMKTTHKNWTNTHNDTINTRNNINQTHEKHTTHKTHHEERTQFNPLKNDQYKKENMKHTQRAFFWKRQ